MRTIDDPIDSCGLWDLRTLSIVQIGLETTEISVKHETQIDTAIGR